MTLSPCPVCGHTIQVYEQTDKFYLGYFKVDLHKDRKESAKNCILCKLFDTYWELNLAYDEEQVESIWEGLLWQLEHGKPGNATVKFTSV